MSPPRGRSSFNPTQDLTRRSGTAAIGSRLAAGALIVLGLLLAWRAATIGFATFIAAEDPGLALRFDPGQPEALVRQARERLLDGDGEAAEALTRKAVQSRPLNAPAFRAMAFAASEQGDDERADVLMADAAALSRRDPAASSWMFSKALRERDYRRAFVHADALLRRSPDYADTVYPRMIAAADQPAAADALVRRLAHDPNWRAPFLATLAGQGAEETIRGVLRRVQASPRPLDDQEMAWVLRRYLVRHSRQDVRGLWTELLPARDRRYLAAIFDGGFETRPEQQPFAWHVTAESSVSAEFAQAGGSKGKALHAEHYGSKTERIIGQAIALSPGAWRLSGRVMAERGQPDALVWRLDCDPGNQQLANVRPVRPGGWQPFHVDFTVPAGCDTQYLALVAEPLGGGAVAAWFDDLRIAPAGAQP